MYFLHSSLIVYFCQLKKLHLISLVMILCNASGLHFCISNVILTLLSTLIRFQALYYDPFLASSLLVGYSATLTIACFKPLGYFFDELRAICCLLSF